MIKSTLEILEAEEEMTLLDEFVDLETGLIREIFQPGVGFEDPALFVGIALPSRIWNTGLFAGRHALSEGNAVGDRKSAAVMGAIGESLERYCLAFYDRRDLVFGSYDGERERGGLRMVDPDDFALFADDQRISWGSHFTRQSPVYWTEGVSLVDKRSIWVPAQFVYLPYAPSPDEDYVFWSTSTGAAFGPSLERAALSGLCETVERDAFSIYWLNQLELAQIDLSPHAGLTSWYEGLFGRFDNELCLYDITTDLGIPCFFVSLAGRPGQDEPCTSVGAACHPDPERAIKKAIVEAFHTRRYGMNLMQIERGTADASRAPSLENNRFHAHVLRYTLPVPNEVTDFFRRPARSESVLDVLGRHEWQERTTMARLARSVRALHAHGHQTIVVDVTTDEIAEKGFFAVKTLVPGLHPLWAGDDVPLGGKRIYDVPPRLGHPRRARAQMNVFDHPFP